MVSKRFVFVLVVGLMLVSVWGCQPKAADKKPSPDKPGAQAPKKGGTLTYQLIEPAYIDPYNAQETEGTSVVANICDSLVDFDPLTSKILPAAAESWESSEEGKVWTLHLRKDAKFHNGRAVSAADFKYAFERMADPATKPAPSDVSYHLMPIVGFDEMQGKKAKELTGMKVIDDLTLEITLTAPSADFIYVLGHPALAPVPKEEVEKDPKAFSEMPICNGPFKMNGPWKHDESISVVRFDDYYGEMALLDAVDYRIFKDVETAFLEFKAGTLHFTQIPPGQINATVAEYGKSDHQTKEGATALLGAEASVYYLNMNNDNKFLKNAVLRRAISLAIDRKSIGETVYEGTRSPATGILPPGTVGFVENAGQYSHFDKTKAEELLTEAGFPGGKGLPTFKLIYNTGVDHQQVMQVVQANLKDIGINTTLEGMEFAALIEKRQKGDFELSRDGWVLDYPIAHGALNALFNSAAIGADNTSRFKNAEVDALLKQGATEAEDDARVQAMQKAEKIVLDEAAVAPIVFYSHRHVAQKNVRDLYYSPLAIAYLEKAWLADE